jgi:membrane protease subunit HflK
MHETAKHEKEAQAIAPLKGRNDELDAAGKSLSDALRISFIILKVIMVVLILAFLASGFKTVGSDEKALVLRFGKIKGVTTDEKVLGPGLHWIFPYPVDELVRIPVERRVNLAVNTFWHQQTKDEVLGESVKKRRYLSEKLDPVKDGYCLTRSQRQGVMNTDESWYNIQLQIKPMPDGLNIQVITGAVQSVPAQLANAQGSDYNIVHSKWQITYQIGDIEQFFRNVYIEDVKPGQVYFDVVTKNITPILENLLDDAVVNAMVHYTINEVLFEQIARLTDHVKRLLQAKLNAIESGIKIVQVQLTDITWPVQVDEAFSASITASQESQKSISEAKMYAESALNEAAGPIAERLYAVLQDETVTQQDKELLWSQLSGKAQEKIAEAQAYGTKVRESAKADADYLHRLLPEYRKHPELVVQRIYKDTIEQVMSNVDEKFIIQGVVGAKKEIRILLNRDPTLKPRTKSTDQKSTK